MTKKIAHWLITNRNLLVVLSMVVIAACGLGIEKLGFNGDFKHMFGAENRDLLNLQDIENTYLQADNVIVLIKPANTDTVFEKQTLLLVEELTDRLWETPSSIRVDSLSNYNRSHSEDDTFYVDPLIESAGTITDEGIQSIREYAQTDTYLKKGLVSENEKVTSMIVTLALPDDPITRLPAVTEMVEFLEALTQEMTSKYPGLEMHFMGGPSMEATMVDIAANDLNYLMPVTVFVCFAVLGVLLRSGTAVLGTVFLIITANVMTMGLAGWMGFQLTPTSMMAPLMVMILAMADSIHVLTQYIQYFRQGMTKVEAMTESIASNMVAILLTSITTAIGFLGMNFSESPTFHDFGNITAMGVLYAFLLTLTLLPGVILWFPMKATVKPLALTPFMEKYADFVIKNSRPLIWVFALAVPAVCAFIPMNELNDDIVAYFDEKVPFRESVDFANEHLSGFQYILYSLDNKEEGAVNDTDYLKKVDAFSDWLREQPYVSHVFSYVDIMQNLNKAMHNDDEAFDTVPESRELASQYLFLYEMSLPAGHDLTRDLNSSRSASRLMVSLNTMTNQELIDLDLRAQQWLHDNAPELESPGGSRSLMFANLGLSIVTSMISGSIFAMGAITIVILIGIRSLRYGLISLIPNVLPAACVYGAWGFFVGEVNQAAAMVFSMSIGLVVDDTVHFLAKYLKALKSGKSAEDAIRYAFTSAGSALLVTSLAISSGQAVMALSSFNPNTTMAVMLVSILLFALVLDFMLLPPLLLMFDKQKDKVMSTISGKQIDVNAGDIEIDVAESPAQISESLADEPKLTT